MSDVVIRVEDLSKQYRLGTVGTGTLAHDLNRWWCKFRGKPDPYLKVTQANDRAHKGDSDYVWALRDINFEVKQGEVLGIIGANGAGKSTLLKILSRITAPTEGIVRAKGRIAALLEVGTGFHPELTGRENIFLNGAILGMTKAEVRGKLDEIVDFSGCERYLDTPVKRYSSGMMVRLGFAVAAHLEPEILIVDEVLAVGDAEFQKKCLGKMDEVAKGGRTILFVSHNMMAIRNLCPTAMWLEDGKITDTGPAPEVTEKYLHQSSRAETIADIAEQVSKLPPDPAIRIVNVTVRQDDRPTTTVIDTKPVEIEFVYDVLQQVKGLRVFFDLCDDFGDVLIRSFSDENGSEMSFTAPGRFASVARIPANLLAPRNYVLILRATIYMVRVCSTGIQVGLSVQKASTRNRAYPGQQPSKLQPAIAWDTSRY